jgi:hypothetical protein
MKKLLLALALVVSPVMAQNPPIGIKPITVQMQLFCAESFEFLMNVLAADFAADFKEYPVMMGYLKEGQSQAHTLIYFTNKEKTQSTLVVSKTSKDKEEACIIWSGESPSGMAFCTSPSGMAFSVNPNPEFPEDEI